jgi:hypothetical protein
MTDVIAKPHRSPLTASALIEKSMANPSVMAMLLPIK